MIKILLLPLKIAIYIIYLVLNFLIIPFRLLFSLLTPNHSIKMEKYYTNNNIWGLSKEDKKIARSERMSDADYIEAEERDDDNLDTDD